MFFNEVLTYLMGQIWLMEHIEQLESELEDQICNINMALAECSSNKRLSRGEVEPDFISAVPNDVLLQIFVRLPDVQSVVRCSAVCKRWSSLISNLSNSFIRGFIQYHKGEMSSSDSLPYTMLLFLFDGKLFYQLFSKGSKSLHRRAYKWSDSFRYLDFLPWPRVHVQASFDDLLLLTPPIYNPRPLQYCICNSLTRRWLILPLEAPPVPHHPNTRHGLVCKPKNCSNDNEDVNNDDNNIRYKVVRLDTDTNSISSVDNGYVLPFTIFCSESGKWSQSTLFAPSALAPRFTHLSEPIGTSNGILHFPVMSGPQGRRGGSFTGSILAFDPFGDSSTPDPKQSKFIDKPAGFSPTAKSCLGVVKGQLRLWQSGIFDAGNFFFKIWELNYEHQISDGPSTTSWLLLYDGKVKKQIAWRMSMAGFDPDNGNVVFIMTYSGGIYKYKIEEEEYEQVGEIPSDILSKG